MIGCRNRTCNACSLARAKTENHAPVGAWNIARRVCWCSSRHAPVGTWSIDCRMRHGLLPIRAFAIISRAPLSWGPRPLPPQAFSKSSGGCWVGVGEGNLYESSTSASPVVGIATASMSAVASVAIGLLAVVIINMRWMMALLARWADGLRSSPLHLCASVLRTKVLRSCSRLLGFGGLWTPLSLWAFYTRSLLHNLDSLVSSWAARERFGFGFGFGGSFSDGIHFVSPVNLHFHIHSVGGLDCRHLRGI
jgi:hypothetical protein